MLQCAHETLRVRRNIHFFENMFVHKSVVEGIGQKLVCFESPTIKLFSTVFTTVVKALVAETDNI